VDRLMVSTLVLDLNSLTLLHELLDLPLPASFSPVWDRAADPTLVATARTEAGQRLRTAGLLLTGPAAGEGESEQVHPSLRSALENFGRARILVDVRTWAGDRAVLADLAVGVDAGVGLTRLQRVTPDGDEGPTTPEDALGAELAVFEADDVVSALQRLLPPLPDPGSAPEPVRIGWPDATALLTLLQRRDSMNAGQLPVAQEVLRILLGSADLVAVPPVLDLLAGPLQAAIRITLSARGPEGENTGPRAWFGYWVQCGGQLVALRAAGDAEPGRDGGVVLDLVPTDGPGLRADLLAAVVGAFETSGLGGARR
jgi:hypothetical protein